MHVDTRKNDEIIVAHAAHLTKTGFLVLCSLVCTTTDLMKPGFSFLS